MIGIDLRANFYKLCTYALLILAAAGAAGTWWYWDSAKDAKKDLAVAEAQRDKARYIAEQVMNFNAGFQRTTQTLRTQLMVCQAGVRKAKVENENALSKAIASARDADATLKKFAQQFDAKPKTCAAALAELDRSCESLAGY